MRSPAAVHGPSSRKPSTEPGSDTNLVPLILETLLVSATPASPWYLSDRQRWRWLVDTVLGHPKIRGGLRPRDFPADPVALETLQWVMELQKRPHSKGSGATGTYPRNVKWPFGSWLVAFILLVEKVAQEGQNPEELLRQATFWLCQEILRVAKAKDDRFELMAHLGMGIRDEDNAPPEKEISELSRVAAWSAHLAELGLKEDQALSPEECPELDPGECLEEGPGECPEDIKRILLNKQIRILKLEPYKPQKYIEKGKFVWIQRGASVWCSQAMAMLRDIVAESHDDLILLGDAGAVVTFVDLCPEHTPEFWINNLEEQLSIFMRDGFDKRFPELASKRKHAELVGIHADACLPSFEFRLSGSVCFNDLLHPQSIDPRDSRHPIPRTSNDNSTGSGCDWVEGEDGIFTFREGVDGKTDPRKPPIKFSWIAAVWRLAGSTFRAHSIAGFGHQLDLKQIKPGHRVGDWLAAIKENTNPLAYVRLDGDHVGEALGKSPFLCRPRAGLELGGGTFNLLLAGIRETIASWLVRHPGSELNQLPVDILFIGGDDIFIAVPEPLLEAFLSGFSRGKFPQATKSFTGAAIICPAGPPPGEREAIGKIMGKVCNRMVKEVKYKDRKKPMPQDWDSSLEISERSGFKLIFQNRQSYGDRLHVHRFRLDFGSGHICHPKVGTSDDLP